jgi:hypothetical protein
MHRRPLPLPLLLPPLLALLLVAPGSGCAHTEPRGTLATLRPVAEAFHEAVRWGNYATASRLMVPETGAAFEKARRATRDAENLTITDYELEDVQLLEEGRTARVTARMQWFRLPSASARTDDVVTRYVFREGRWLLERVEGGPFDP